MLDKDKVLLDWNNPVFQDNLIDLEKENILRVLASFRRIKKLSWTEIYNDKGLRWEKVKSTKGPSGQSLYTIRISQGFRALVFREGRFMRFLSLHPDHDSAYKSK